jgi:hypothetical protein
MGKINAEWHEAHIMPKNPTKAQRARWHYEHALNCGCRAPSAATLALMEAEGFRLTPVAR